MERARFLILGAGVAGAATAYGLTRAGATDVLIVERDAIPGTHASGRNASLVRRNLKTETDCVLSLQAADWFRKPPADLGRELAWRECGSLMLFRREERARIDRELALQRKCGLSFEEITPRAAKAREPLLEESAFDAAQWTPGDGRIDILELLHGYLEAAARRGARLKCGIEARSLLVEGGRCVGIETAAGPIRAEVVVNAAGAWANSLVRGAAAALPMTPCRRTMVVTEPVGADPNHPFTWDDGRGFYFREDHGGLLWSPCDEVPSEECDERVDPKWVARARACARELIPAASGAAIAFSWGCLRTVTFDREMMVGPDPALPGLFWVAGLGGHGVTMSPRIAELAADLLLSRETSVLDIGRVAPRRAGAPA